MTCANHYGAAAPAVRATAEALASKSNEPEAESSLEIAVHLIQDNSPRRSGLYKISKKTALFWLPEEPIRRMRFSLQLLPC